MVSPYHLLVHLPTPRGKGEVVYGAVSDGTCSGQARVDLRRPALHLLTSSPTKVINKPPVPVSIEKLYNYMANRVNNNSRNKKITQKTDVTNTKPTTKSTNLIY